MRVVVDTNVLVSALLGTGTPPAQALDGWLEGRFELVSSEVQLDELTRVTRYPKIRARLPQALAGRLINEIRKLAVYLANLPTVEISPDPYDNYLLAMAQAGEAQYLVSGDKRGMLTLKQHGGTKIVSVREFLALLGEPKP